jgi:hypothetical protein
MVVCPSFTFSLISLLTNDIKKGRVNTGTIYYCLAFIVYNPPYLYLIFKGRMLDISNAMHSRRLLETAVSVIFRLLPKQAHTISSQWSIH